MIYSTGRCFLMPPGYPNNSEYPPHTGPYNLVNCACFKPYTSINDSLVHIYGEAVAQPDKTSVSFVVPSSTVNDQTSGGDSSVKFNYSHTGTDSRSREKLNLSTAQSVPGSYRPLLRLCCLMIPSDTSMGTP